MGNIRKVGDVYFIEFYARGLLYSKIGGTDLDAARKLLAETEAAIAGGEALTVSRSIELPVFFDQFRQYARAEFGARSLGRFDAAIRHFGRFLEGQGVAVLPQVTPGVFEAYKAALAAAGAPRTVNFTLLLLREVMEYGIRTGHINDNPTLHIRLLPLPPRNLKHTQRSDAARELLGQNVPLGKVCRLLGLSDVARICYFITMVPASRQDIYH